VTNPDGSVTTTVTDQTTGAVTQTTTSSDTADNGTVTERVVESVTNAQGVTTTTETVKATAANGTTATKVTSTAADGSAVTRAEAVVSQQAAQSGQAVTLPIDLYAVPAKVSDTAPTVTVTVPETAEEITVEIPVSNVTNTTVVLLVNPDGTEEILKKSIVTDDGCVDMGITENVTLKLIDNEKEFVDVGNHWAGDAIDFVAARTIFNGDTAGNFQPDVSMTRGMLAQVLYNLEQNPEAVTTGAIFPDVDSDDWYADAISWASANGVTNGYGNGSFGPDDSITREQLVTMLYRYFGGSTVSGAISRFPDAGQVSSYAVDAMNWAVGAGIITGTSAGTLSPTTTASRAEVATMFQRFLNILVQ
jgi:hypothetical protein